MKALSLRKINGAGKRKIKFVKMFGNYKTNDKVEFTLEGEKVFTGVIQKITNYCIELEITPLWGMLDYVFITGSLEIEGTGTVYKTLLGLKEKIESVDILFNSKIL